jgi:hypothetical protein
MTSRYAAIVKICTAQHGGRTALRQVQPRAIWRRQRHVDRTQFVGRYLANYGRSGDLGDHPGRLTRLVLFQLAEPPAPQAFWPRLHRCLIATSWRTHTLAL